MSPSPKPGTARRLSWLSSDRLLERFRQIPGVRAAAAGTPLPLTGHEMTVGFDIEERPAAAPDRPNCDMAIVTPDYFGALGIPLLRGRDFSERDDTTAPRALVVNEAFARKYFPGEDALGKRIVPGATNGKEGTIVREIVGIVSDARQAPMGTDPDPIYYFPLKQLSWGLGTVVLRTAGHRCRLKRQSREVLTEMDREIPMCRIRTGEELAAAAITAPRFLMVLMAGFAGMALLLTVFGLYGLLSYTVARRRREIGVRMAVGAARRDVLGLVLRDAMRLVGAGLLFGLVAASVVQRLLSTVTFGIRPGDPIFLAVACGLLVIGSLAAVWIPALRAASVDPMRVLRSE